MFPVLVAGDAAGALAETARRQGGQGDGRAGAAGETGVTGEG